MEKMNYTLKTTSDSRGDYVFLESEFGNLKCPYNECYCGSHCPQFEMEEMSVMLHCCKRRIFIGEEAINEINIQLLDAKIRRGAK